MKVTKQLVHSKYVLSLLSNYIYLNNNTSVSNLMKMSSKALVRKSADSLIFRFINNYGDFSTFISKFVTISNKPNKVGFVELDLIAWDFVFVNLLQIFIDFFSVKLIFCIFL